MLTFKVLIIYIFKKIYLFKLIIYVSGSKLYLDITYLILI